MFLAEVVDARRAGLKMRNPSMADQGESNGLIDVLVATIIASTRRCDGPSVGDSAGTEGRRTYAAGE